MRQFILLALLVLNSFLLKAQRADGFFIQEFCFVDINLVKQLKVDKIDIVLYANNRYTGKVQLFLDSNYRKIREIVDYGDSTRVAEFASTTISQFSCPVNRPDYIKECVNGRITRTNSRGAYRETTFDSAGRVIADKWRPGEALLEINREFSYSKSDLLTAASLKDIRKDGSIDKEELHLFEYENERLVEIKQLIKSTGDFQEAGKFNFKYYGFGLMKAMEGTGYFGRYKARVEFKYYSKHGHLAE